jgi:predicted dehydrogenase
MTLRVGLIGCGWIGRFHSTGIRAIERRRALDIEYRGVADIDPARTKSFSEITGARAYRSPDELLDSGDVDAVYVCVPTGGHKALVLKAAERGLHVFCEKPLATTLRDVEEMVAAVEHAGVKAGVGLVLRHSPILTVMKQLMDDPTIGRPMQIVFRDDQFFPIQGHYASEWRKDVSQAGAGTLLEHSIHDVDVLHWLAGRVVALQGHTSNFAGYQGIEDLASAHLEFESGARAELVSIWHSVLGRPSTRRLEVFFEKGFFAVENDYIGPIHYQVHAQNAQTMPAEEVQKRYLAGLGMSAEMLEGILRYSLEDYFFLRACLEDLDVYPDFRVALEAHRVVDAVYRSASLNGERIILA